MKLRSRTAHFVLLVGVSTLLTGNICAVEDIPDMRVDDLQQLGKAEGGEAQIHYLSAVASEFAQKYDDATAKRIRDFFNVPHGRTYGEGVYVVAGYIKKYIKPEEEHGKSVKGIVDLCIVSEFGGPPTPDMRLDDFQQLGRTDGG